MSIFFFGRGALEKLRNQCSELRAIIQQTLWWIENDVALLYFFPNAMNFDNFHPRHRLKIISHENF